MLAQLWSGGYLLDWAGLVFEFAGAAVAALGILPSSRYSADQDGQHSMAFMILQSRQLRFGLILLAIGSLLQCAGTFQAALPFFAK